MEFSILGPLVVRAGDAIVELGGARRRSLVALLLLQANRTVSAERLIEDLWEGAPPDGASATLQSHVSALRKALGAERITTQGGGYSLVVGDGELDSAVFEAD